MGMFAVKNNKGEWLGWEVYQDDPEFICGGGSVWTDLDKAKFYAKANSGHVVELVDAPEKIVVSQEEAEMLEHAKCDDDPAELIVGFVNSRENYDDDLKAEDRLMRAYVNGYTVAKEKRYNVKVPHTKYVWYYKSCNGYLRTISNKELCSEFTEAEIEHYGLQDCEKVECDNDD